MGLSRVVGSIAVCPAALGWALRPLLPFPVTFVLFHVAATGFVVATAASEPFAPRTQSLLGKGKDGRVRFWGKALFWPYHLGLRARHYWRKLISDEPLYHEIIPGWFVGGWPTSDCVLPNGDPSVIDCTCELPKMHDTKRYLCLHVWDTHGATAAQIKKGVDWATAEKEKNHPLYIHCAHGHGRSVALLIACFLKLGVCKSIAEGEAMIKSVRPKIRLNDRQRKEITKWMQTEGLSVAH